MADLHILLVVDSETGEVGIGDLQSMPVDSRESVFDDPDWRIPTEKELDMLYRAEADIAFLIDTLVVAHEAD